VTEEHTGPSSRTSRVIRARREELYAAFLDPDALIDWLPPAEMTGVIHEFDPRVGGGYRMSLFYPPDERIFRGKTSGREDMVNVRFVELALAQRIVEAVSFVTADPAFCGEITLTATFEEVPGGTEVMLEFKSLPPGLRPEDNGPVRASASSSWPAASRNRRLMCCADVRFPRSQLPQLLGPARRSALSPHRG